MVEQIETDYLVVGAGASGMSFVDTLVSNSDATFVLVDERRQPGGHWVDAYPFVQLHQPSAYYGVNSLPLGQDRIDTTGINAGFYERARAAEIVDYFERALFDVLLPSGRVLFRGSTRYVGKENDHHVLQSNLSGKKTHVKVRKALVDATVMQSSVPATHTRKYSVDSDVKIVTPNELVKVVDANGYTVVGAGKTSMDVCFWLLEQGVDPDQIEWIRPRDGWFTERTYTQPLSLAKNMVRFQSQMFAAIVDATSGFDWAKRMESEGMMMRLDDSIDASVFRGATVAKAEIEALRTIENVIRKGKVKRISANRIELTEGDHKTNPGRVFVDCTAVGLATTSPGQIFEPGQVNLFFTTTGVAPWSASVVGIVDTLDMSLDDKNKLCPAMPRAGTIEGQLNLMKLGFDVEIPRRANPDLATWSSSCRLNPGRTIADHMDDPEVQAAFGQIIESFEPALANLNKLISR